MERVVCERVFIPQGGVRPSKGVRSLESGRPLGAFDIIAFSISFEEDYLNVLRLLKWAGLPLGAENRSPPHPLVIAGGVACFLNPEPISQFVDCILIGDAEVLLPRFMALYKPDLDKEAHG